MSDKAIIMTFTGSLTKDDSKTYHPFSFYVPEGITNIHIDFEFSPFYAEGRIHRNQINVSLNDPDGIRGVWCIINEVGIDVNGVQSTPGFRTADIQSGQWTAFVDSHRILPPSTVEYKMTVTLSSDPLTIKIVEYDGSQRVAKTEAGWYRGDLHGHTLHSDGRWDVPEFTEFQRSRGLDFVSLTDHNIISGLAQHRSQTEDGFLAMGGMELSTFNGHMLALGGYHWYEWRLNIEEGMDIHRIMQNVIDRGELLIIAHPMSPDEPFCSGCMWTFETARPGVALGVEVWNGFWHMFNEEGLQQYYVWLNKGRRLICTSGTDIHGPHPLDTDRRAGFNVVYAEELSEKAILDALRLGHSYISAGPELLMTAETASGKTAMVGDLLPDESVTISVTWNDAHDGDVLYILMDGKVYEELPVKESGEHTVLIDAGQAKWINVELRDATRDMWALTNPIYFGDWD